MKHEKMFVSVLAIALIAMLSVEPVMAFLATRSAEKENKFTASKVVNEVNETFDQVTKKDVSFKNTGDTTAYFRVAIIPMWVDADKNVASETPVEGTDYYISFATNNGWIKGTDGYYYYAYPVDPTFSTNFLITSCKPISKEFGYDATGKKTVPLSFDLDIAVSSIQYVPTSVVAQEWGVTVNADGSIAPKGGVIL